MHEAALSCTRRARQKEVRNVQRGLMGLDLSDSGATTRAVTAARLCSIPPHLYTMEEICPHAVKLTQKTRLQMSCYKAPLIAESSWNTKRGQQLRM